jgi:hypothetical protein
MRTNEQLALKNRVLGAILVAASTLISLGFSCEGSSIDFRPRIGEGQRRQQEPPPPPKELLAGIFVDANSKASKPDGKSWEKAFRTIGEGVNAARAGGKVIIAHGQYLRPAVDLTNKKDIALEGGYEPGDKFVKPVEEYTDKNRVVLDGDGQAQWLVRIAGSAQNINIRGNFEFRNVAGSSAVIIEGTAAQNIKNVTLAYGLFTKNNAGAGAGHFGGGLRIVHAENVVLDHLTAVENQAQDGGFLHAADVRGLTMIKSKWERNRAIFGGGALHLTRIEGLRNSDGEALENTADTGGGAIWLERIQNTELSELRFLSNGKGLLAWGGGALFIQNCDQLVLSRLDFVDNHADESQGGAAFVNNSRDITFSLAGDKIAKNNALQGGAFYFLASHRVVIKGGTFSENTATSANAQGGAILVSGSDEFALENATFLRNMVQDGSGVAGDKLGGAVYLERVKKARVVNNLFEKNEAKNNGFGGALAFYNLHHLQNQVKIISNKFLGNTVDGNAGAIYATGNLGPVTINDSEFQNNFAGKFGGALVLQSVMANPTHFMIDAKTSFINNHAQAPDGGGVAMFLITPNPTAYNSGTLTFEAPLAKFVDNKSSNNFGNIIRISAQGSSTTLPLPAHQTNLNAQPYTNYLNMNASGFTDGAGGLNIFIYRP